ncbi:MAG: AAA family ATPase [Chloroflexota bacterium]
MLRFPYAIREFDKIIEGEYVYLDRTHCISIIEEWGYELIFLRPRRMGKSLWLSTLMTYYDVARADDFERLFGHLAIGKNPTPLHNQYLVMRWDFSTVKSHGTAEAIEVALNRHINRRIERFALTYQERLNSSIHVHADDALSSLQSLLASTDKDGYKVYLFIDEYDNFANEVMMSALHDDDNRYESLVTGEGIFKTFFKNLKSLGSGDGLDRVFVTGVSPAVMNDVTSGANVFEDIYWFQELNDLCGFRESEIADMLAQVLQERGLPDEEREDRQAEALSMMRTYYDGSWFTTEVSPPNKVHQNGQTLEPTVQPVDLIPPSESRLYNPTLVFYFLRYLQRTGKYPDQMLDSNLQTDSNKLAYIAHYGMGRTVLVDGFNQQQDIRVPELSTHFGAEEMLQEDMLDNRLASLLCYLGALTINGKADDGDILLTIPNLVMKNVYAERIQQMAIPDPVTVRAAQDAVNTLFHKGQLQPLCDFLEENLMSIYNNRDYPQFKELTLKSLFIALLYQNNLYTIYSEPTFGRRYGDLLLWLKPDKRQNRFFNLLFEFKQIQLNKLIESPGDQSGKSKNVPLSGKEVKAKGQAELLTIPAVQEAMDEAKTQLHDYQHYLQDQFGTGLKLRSYAVVGVGLDRILFDSFELPERHE